MPDYPNKQTLSESFPETDSGAYFALRDELAEYSCDIISNEPKAREIADESLKKLANCREHFQTKEQCENYLYVVARDFSIDYLKYLSKFSGS
jgi:DNA-directed RNA polymerase specialized sigma24 family protein